MERKAGTPGELRARGKEGWLVVCPPGSCQPFSLLVGEHSDPPSRTLRLAGLTASYNGSFQSFELCRSQVHLIFPFCKMGCMGWRESE